MRSLISLSSRKDENSWKRIEAAWIQGMFKAELAEHDDALLWSGKRWKSQECHWSNYVSPNLYIEVPMRSKCDLIWR